jgi:lambda family phage minor tail protein L
MPQESKSNWQLGHNQENYQKINTTKLNEELQSLQGSVIIELFEIDTGKYGGQIYRFHAGQVVQGDIVFNDKTYSAYPIEVEDFEIRGDGSLPRPKMTLANVDGFVSTLIAGKDDFVGLKVKRIRTFLRYLDEANFIDNINPFGTPDETAKFPDERYFINRKIVEDKNAIQFELSSELEMESVKLPSRTVYANHCPWVYRGEGCGYGNLDIYSPTHGWYDMRSPLDINQLSARLGHPIGDSDNNSFAGGQMYNFSTAGNAPWQEPSATPFIHSGSYDATGIYASGDFVSMNSAESLDVVLYFVARPTGIMATEAGDPTYPITFYNVSGKDPRYDSANWVQDQCSKNLSGCLMRFQYSTKGLPYGGFPGTERFPNG